MSESNSAMRYSDLDRGVRLPVSPVKTNKPETNDSTTLEPLECYIQQLTQIRVETQHSEDVLKQFEHTASEILLSIQVLRKTNHDPSIMESMRAVNMLRIAQRDFSIAQASLHQQVNELTSRVNKLTSIQQAVVDGHIAEWRRLQQLSANDSDLECLLRKIQGVCEPLADRIWESFLFAQMLGQACSGAASASSRMADACSQEKVRIGALMQAFIRGSTVIERQPPRVIRTNARFSATLRMLIGDRLNVHMLPPTVIVSIISEAQARASAQDENYSLSRVSGEIRNNEGAMVFDETAKALKHRFFNMTVKNIERAHRSGSASVTDEKFCLSFSFMVNVGEITVAVRTLSLPVVVTVHASQEADGLALINWDNAFSRIDRLPFVVPEAVPWREMTQLLTRLFLEATGKGLSESDLQFLAKKAFREPDLPVDCGDRLIRWSEFCKYLFAGRTFSFWDWFYAILRNTREYLKAQWNDGLIMGFIGRHEAEAILLQRPPGTFLLRFSDSQPGGVSIAVVSQSHDQEKEVRMVQPFTARDFKIRSISDRISDLPDLVCLYPDLPRDSAFGKYYTTSTGTTSTPHSDYVNPRLVLRIDEIKRKSQLHPDRPTSPPHNRQASEAELLLRSDEGKSGLNSGFTDHDSLLYESMKRRRCDDPLEST